jgi:large subunit GTPase 1
LEKYVKEVDIRKENLLLVNKADMMTLAQREVWAGYFEQAGINYKFFSAVLAKELKEARDLENSDEDGRFGGQESADDEDEEEIEESDSDLDSLSHAQDGRLAKAARMVNLHSQDRDGHEDHMGMEEEEKEDPRTKILTVDELEALFLKSAPEIEQTDADNPRKTQVGLVGYPNVGKSSTINALIGAKKVSVSSTPGKTKHFQTIHLSPEVILCDCPGLVFPNFASTKAELVCNGILPIDQLREFTGPAGLVAQRIPQTFYEAVYGVKVHTRPLEEGGTGIPTAEEILTAYAVARGFAKTGLGQPDESRAARYILKDYVSGKLLFCHPPPIDPPVDPIEFNHELYDVDHLPQRRRAAILARRDSASLVDAGASEHSSDSPTAAPQGAKTGLLDRRFFGPGTSHSGHLTMPFNHKYSEQGMLASGKQLSGRKQRAMIALERNIDPKDVKLSNGKKHYKGGSRRRTKAGVAEET